MYEGYETNQGSAAKSLMVFICGAAIGASAMLLYAPASGSETRARIADKATELKDRAGEWTGQAVDKAAEWKEKALTTAADTLDRASESFKNSDGASSIGQTKQTARV